MPRSLMLIDSRGLYYAIYHFTLISSGLIFLNASETTLIYIWTGD